jgi:hypothetical protein|tara:strand:- start:655 stop:969 length:315 start_codon:yes stop_codon:yes gene_type:complete
MAFTETLTQFFNDRDFAVSATLTDVSASTTSTIKGIFDNASALVEVGEIDIDETAPIFRCAYADVSSAVEDDTLQVDSVTYKIVGSVIRDVAGVDATLILKDSS